MTASRPSRRRAVMMIWFAAVTIPVMFFVSALTIDYAEILMSRRQLHAIVQDAAVTATREFLADGTTICNTNKKGASGTVLLDPNKVGATNTDLAQKGRVQKTIDSAVKAGALTDRVKINTITVTLSNNCDPSWPTRLVTKPPTVTVKVNYTVSGMVMFGVLDLLFNGNKNGGSLSGVSTKSAVVCLPGKNPETFTGECARTAS